MCGICVCTVCLQVWFGFVWGNMCSMCFHMLVQDVYMGVCACVSCEWNVAYKWEVTWYGSMYSTWNGCVLHGCIYSVYLCVFCL